MKRLVVLLLATLVATSAFAVADPDDNMIGIYFDREATMNCTTVGASVPFFAYVIATNCTVPTISFYEFGYRNEVPLGMETMFFRLSDAAFDGYPNALDIGGGDAILGDHICAADIGFAVEPAMVLHSYQFMLLTPMAVDMFIFQSSAPSVPGTVYPDVMDDETKLFSTLGQSTGGPDIPVAQINPEGDCVVSVESASFGSVKSLFR